MPRLLPLPRNKFTKNQLKHASNVAKVTKAKFSWPGPVKSTAQRCFDSDRRHYKCRNYLRERI